MAFAPVFGRQFAPTFDRHAAVRNELLNGLVAYWTLNEASGQRNDVHTGGYHLSAYGSPAGRTGKLSSAVDLVGTTHYLCRYNPEVALRLPSGTSKTVSAWLLKTTSISIYGMSLWSNPGGYRLLMGSFGVRVNNFTETQSASDPAAINNGEWYHCCGWYDNTAGTYGTVYFCRNNGTVYSTALTKQYSYDPTLSPLCIGPLRGDFGNADGAADEVGMWNRVLTADQRAALYNAGAGLSYANFTT